MDELLLANLRVIAHIAFMQYHSLGECDRENIKYALTTLVKIGHYADASLFPGSIGLNSQWAIMAISSLASKKILAEVRT